jgi:hypothetical protein
VAAVNGFNQFSTILKVEKEIERIVNQDDASIDLDSQGLPWVVTKKSLKAGHCNSSKIFVHGRYVADAFQ